MKVAAAGGNGRVLPVGHDVVKMHKQNCNAFVLVVTQ